MSSSTTDPHEFEIILLDNQDVARLQETVRLFEEVFEMQQFTMPDADYLLNLLMKPTFLVFVALFNNKIVGGLTAHILDSYYYESADVYIYDLAVKREFQRKGIGRQLIIATREYSRSCGYNEVFVQADKPDQYALDFYQATGGTPEEVVHYTYILK